MPMRTSTKAKIAGSLIAAAALFGGGTAFGNYLADQDSKSDATAESSPSASPSPSASASTEAEVRINDAVAAALDAVPGTATAASLEDEGGSPAWDIDVLGDGDTWHEVSVDAVTAIAKDERADGDADDARMAKAAKTSLTEAVDAAEKKVPGEVTSIGLDERVGGRKQLNWEAELRADDQRTHEIRVDAETGKVIEARVDADG
ncbi:PepSY domain-containing protein [Streptomyces sp. A7024]|uniref:PepSY domain-containing protein n=1 Tax=Streptomyces coryli TaxID=1128680 RepID=A0A6G4U1E5_9ACTN|nr:PepSY domain-containing protein [Streptomyces coryli]NGN66055.1 PepSY domain-containing protein [Streptomyces coryli]